MISWGAIFIVGFFVLLNAPKISDEAYSKYYKIDGVEIPTIATVIKDGRTVTEMSVDNSAKNPYKSFTYTDVTSIKSDIKTYIEHLVTEEEFEIKFEENADTVLWQAVLSKYNNSIKKNVVVKINCDVNKYTITIKTTEGGEF